MVRSVCAIGVECLFLLLLRCFLELWPRECLGLLFVGLLHRFLSGDRWEVYRRCDCGVLIETPCCRWGWVILVLRKRLVNRCLFFELLLLLLCQRWVLVVVLVGGIVVCLSVLIGGMRCW